MTSRIFYFTGTGNSLKVARDLAKNLAECDIRAITQEIKREERYDKVGFVFPVYAWGPPVIVARFVHEIVSALKNSYIFAVATFRKEPGAALDYFASILKKKGVTLNAAFGVNMPGNHIASYNVESEGEQERKNREWNTLLPHVAEILNDGRYYWGIKSTITDKFYKTGFKYKNASRQFPSLDTYFRANKKCIGCNTCVKICPVRNIEMVDSKPRWRHHCEQCLACLNWCPQLAIEYGNATDGRERYHNPEIKIEEMLAR